MNLIKIARRIQLLVVAVSIPLLILAGPDLVRAVEIVGTNVLLNIGIGAAAALRTSSNDVDITTGDDGDDGDSDDADDGGAD